MPKPRKVKQEIVERIGSPTFVRADTGAAMFEMGVASFKKLGREANAEYRYKRFVLYNVEEIKAYLEAFRQDP